MVFNPRFNTAPFELNRSPDYSGMLQEGFGGIAGQLQKNRDYAAGLAETKARLGMANEAMDYRRSQDERLQKNWEAEHQLAVTKELWDEAHPTSSGNPPTWIPDTSPGALPGQLKPAPKGPADPEYLKEAAAARSRTPGTKPLSKAWADTVASAGQDLKNLNGTASTFKPEYAGHAATGELGNDMARVGVEWLGSKDQADWWANYRANTATIKRNRLFGASLTDNERADFERSDINPAMDPGLIQKNLARQHDILLMGATKMAGDLLAGGTDPTVVEQQLGVRLDDLGFKIKRDPKTNRVSEITEYPYIEGLSTIGAGGDNPDDPIAHY